MAASPKGIPIKLDLVNIEDLAYLTADEPGIGGVIKRRPEDFLVDENPLYPPTGEGEHLYLTVEKRQRLTTDVVRYLSNHFGVKPRAIGYAGLKDKHAITRQVFTVQHGDIELVPLFNDSHIKILAADLHRNKIKRGHLAGNRFVIKLRDVQPTEVIRAKRLLDHLVEHGVPNYYGEQRFGYRRNNHLLGKALLLGHWQAFLDEQLGRPIPDEAQRAQAARQAYEEGDYEKAVELWPTVHRAERQSVGPLSRGATADQAINGIDRTQLSLLVSAFQSEIFNRVLDQRLRDGTYSKLFTGDVAFKHDSRAMFLVEDHMTEQPRCDALAISPTGPMWGEQMMMPTGPVLEMERAALTQTGMTEEQLAAAGRYAPDGSRRALRMLVRDPEVSGGVDEHGPYIRLAFELGRGSFATTLLREITKAHGHNND